MDALVCLALPGIRLVGTGAGGPRATAVARYRARPVTGIGAAIAVAAGSFHRLALLADGTVRAWGSNDHGQLGDGTRVDRRGPVAVCDLDRVVAIATSGGGHSLALAADGAVHTWGLNAAGQLGDGTTDDRRRPAVVPGLERGVGAIAAGPTASFATLDDGTVLGWGHCLLPDPMRLGLHKLRPVVIEELHGVDAIVPGLATHLALTRQGTVLAWGRARRGAIGTNGEKDRERPGPGPPLDGVVALASGEQHCLALRADGTIWTWGANVFGERGDRDTAGSRGTPLRLEGLTEVSAIAAAEHLSLSLTADGRTHSWGWAHDGLMGRPDEPLGRSVPIRVHGLDDDVVAICPGLALRKDGSLMQWGWAPEGTRDELPIGATKLGGDPDLPDGTQWPTDDDRPLAFVAQIALADLTAAGAGGLPAGLLSFFFAFDETMSGGCVLHSSDGAALRRRDAPDSLQRGARLDPVAVDVQSELTLGPVESDVVAQLALSDDEHWAYHELADSHQEPIHRIFGHPAIVQDDPRTAGDVLLLQVDLDDDALTKHSEGRMYWFIAQDDLAAGRFDRARGKFQQT
jgi:alpha-tubulin suppressor-like RCC1 family protein